MRKSAKSRLYVLDGQARSSPLVSEKNQDQASRLGSPCGCQTIALIAHDAKKDELLAWARANAVTLRNHQIVATQTTGEMLKSELALDARLVNSGPLGGDQEVGALIARGELDMLIFFIDPLGVHPHESDIQSLIRLAILRDVPTAFSPSTASLLGEKLAQPHAVVA
jgi:methylglyoxal synthase